MADRVKVAAAGAIPEGGMRTFDVRGDRVTVANVGGTLCAFHDECTHDYGPLSEGELAGDVVTCPWHFSRFNVRTGEVVDSPADEPVAVYEVEEQDGSIFVGDQKDA